MEYTQKQIDSRTSDYVCWDCGRKFLTEEQKKNGKLKVKVYAPYFNILRIVSGMAGIAYNL